MHACEIHAYEMQMTPIRYTPMRHMPVRCTPMRCMPMKCISMNVGYDSIRAILEMGIVYELVLPDRRKQYTILIPYDEQATSNTLSHV